MRNFVKMAVVIGLAAGLGSTAKAQGFGRGGMGMMGGGLNLLSDKAVQKELKLTDEQIEKAEKANTEMREKRQEKMQELQGLEGAERQEKMQAMMKEFAADSKKVTDSLLKPEQQKRFDQLVLQRQGTMAFNSPEIQSKLKMTDEQKNKLKDLQTESQEKMRELFQPGGDQAEMRTKMQAFQKEMTEKTMALLTEDQKKTWKEMTGEPFTFSPPQGRRPGGN